MKDSFSIIPPPSCQPGEQEIDSRSKRLQEGARIASQLATAAIFLVRLEEKDGSGPDSGGFCESPPQLSNEGDYHPGILVTKE
jgi:hypothetical protein